VGDYLGGAGAGKLVLLRNKLITQANEDSGGQEELHGARLRVAAAVRPPFLHDFVRSLTAARGGQSPFSLLSSPTPPGPASPYASPPPVIVATPFGNPSRGTSLMSKMKRAANSTAHSHSHEKEKQVVKTVVE
jgi:hypothetical protein